MKYRDSLYKTDWEVPDFLIKLIQTKEMSRARNISMAVLPTSLLPTLDSISTRFHHGMGVAYLASIVAKNNPQIGDYCRTLPIASLYHDGGNTPFSHIGEPFLKVMFGKDGETFLEDILFDKINRSQGKSETARYLEELGIPTYSILDLVSGHDKPMSDVLNGTLDLDNLDNICRYARSANISSASNFFPEIIANSFRFTNGQWVLEGRCLSEVIEWQKLRKQVYDFIDQPPYIIFCRMLSRAMELAFTEGHLDYDFFFYDDNVALNYLGCFEHVNVVMERLIRWQAYTEIFFQSLDVKPKIAGNYDSQTEARIGIADNICSELGIEPEDLIVYVGQGREKRNVSIPFIGEDGQQFIDEKLSNSGESKYKVGVYAFGSALEKCDKILELFHQEVVTPVSA